MKKKLNLIGLIILLITILFLGIQVVHFMEHTAQVSVWIFGSKEKPYMSSLGMFLMDKLGILFYPNEDILRRNKLGFELVHLFGNAIFLFGIIGLYHFVKSRKVKWAFIVEGFHLYEHLSLTLSMIYINKPIGISTFFGMEMSQFALVAYRVWWHFIFNLIPSFLIALAIYEIFARYKNRKNRKVRRK